MSPLLVLAILLPVPNDPLPAGALARFGSNHLRATGGARLTADGRTLLALHAGVLRGYDPHTLERTPIPAMPAKAAESLTGTGRVAAWTADGRFLATAVDVFEATVNGGESTTRVTVFDLHAGRPVGGFRHAFLWAGELTTDGRTFVATITDPANAAQPNPPARVVAWDVPSGERRTLHKTMGEGVQVSTALLPDGRDVLIAVAPPPTVPPKPAETRCVTLSTGTTRWTVPGWASGFAFPSGEAVLRYTIADGPTAAVLDRLTGRPVACVRPPSLPAHPEATVFSRDGSRLVATYRTAPAADGTPGPQRLLVWNLPAGKREADWPLPTDVYVAPIAVAADGRTLIADWNGSLRRFDLSTGRPLGAPPAAGHTGQVQRLAFTPDGRSLVSHGFAEVRVWDVRSAGQRTIWPRPPFTPDGVLTADGRQLWAMTKPGRPAAHATDTGRSAGGFEVPLQPSATMPPGGAVPVAVAPLPPPPDPVEESLLALGGTAVVKGFMGTQYASAVVMWLMQAFDDTPIPPAAAPLPVAPPPPLPMCCDATGQPVGHVGVRPDRSAVVHFDPGACVFTGHDPATGRQLWKATVVGEELQKSARSAGTLSPDGRFFAGTLGPIDARTGKRLAKWVLPDGCGLASVPVVSADARLVAGYATRGGMPQMPPPADSSPVLTVWDAGTGAVVGSRAEFQSQVPFAFDPTGGRMVVAAADGLAVWDLRSNGWAVAHATGGGVTSLAVSPDGRTVAVGHRDGTVLLWPLPPTTAPTDADAWDRLARPDGYAAVWALAAEPDAAVRMLEQKLRSTPTPSREQVAAWVRALDSPRYAERAAATRSLHAAGPAAEGELRQALAADSPELRSRAGLILASFDQPTPHAGDGPRTLRAIAVLEHTGTPAARRLLERLAAGGHTPATAAAQDALARLAGRHPPDAHK